MKLIFTRWMVGIAAGLLLMVSARAQSPIDWLKTERVEFADSFTTTERDALTGLTTGKPTLIWNETTTQFEFTDDGGTTWEALAGAGGGGSLDNVVEDTSPQLGADLDGNGFSILFDDGTGIEDVNGNELVTFTATTSAVNELNFSNGATGNGPTIAATGGNVNVDLLLTGKGTGVIKANGNQVITMGASEFSTLTAEASPASSDLILMERASDGAKRKVAWSNVGGGGGGSGTVNFYLNAEDGIVDGSGDVTDSLTLNFYPLVAAGGTAVVTLDGNTATGGGIEFSTLTELKSEIEAVLDSSVTVTPTFNDTLDLLTLEFSAQPVVSGDVILSVGYDGPVDSVSHIAGGLGIVPITMGGSGEVTATAAFDALSPTTTKGDVIVHNGTSNIRLGVGTNDQVLTADSTEASGLKWADAPGGSSPDMVKLATVTASGSASVDFTTAGWFDGTYSQLVLYVSNLQPATDAANPLIRIATAGTFQTTSYTGVMHYAYSAENAHSASATNGMQIFITSGSAVNETATAEMRFIGPSIVGRKQMLSRGTQFDLGGTFLSYTAAGSYTGSTAAWNGIRFLYSSGNIATGTFTLYGLK